MTNTDATPPLVQTPRPWWQDLLSERMLFGMMIIAGFIVILHELIYEQALLRPEIVTIVASGLGAFGAALGVIVQAIWKTDKADKQQAATMASLASTVAAQTPGAEPGKQ